jgi:hypothetical protein
MPFLCVFVAGAMLGAPGETSYVCAPAYCREDVCLAPVTPYAPQPGDLFLATDPSPIAWFGHWVAGGPGVHHSGILFARPDGTMALIESGPFNTLHIEVFDPNSHMADYAAQGSKVWVRRRRVQLTLEQSACLTAFALAQEGKRFAVVRMFQQVGPVKTRGVLRTPFIGRPHGPDRASYYCSELVVEACVAAGLMDPETARPSATYPRDLFDGRSSNPYLNHHLNMEPTWFPPQRWLSAPPEPERLLAPPPALAGACAETP